MKNLLVMDQSLVDSVFKGFKENIEVFKEYKFIFFKDSQKIAEISGTIHNFNSLLNLLSLNHISYEFSKCNGLDEYLLLHKNVDEIYVSQPVSMNAIISSVAIIGFQSPVFICEGVNSSINKPIFKNVQPMARVYLSSQSFGIKGLDFGLVSKEHLDNQNCYFVLNGKKYEEVIKNSNLSDCGNEGYTFKCQSDSKLRIKIYERSIHKYEFEKIQKMILISSILKESALPLAIVYSKNGTPIGIVMTDFEGEDINILDLHKKNNSKKIAQEITKQVIALTTHGVYHKDLTHNILCDFNNGDAHIIDIDSTQFLEYPAVVFTADKNNGIPQQFYNDMLFYNTIDLSYSLLMINLSALINPDDLFGKWDEFGNPILRDDELEKLKRKSPNVYKIVCKAFIDCVPVSFVEQLNALEEVKGKTVIYKKNFESRRDTINTFYDKKDGNRMDELRYKDNHITKQVYNIISYIKKIILYLFLKNGKTSIVGETDDDRWRRFIREEQWISPLISFLAGVLIIVVLLLAFEQL